MLKIYKKASAFGRISLNTGLKVSNIFWSSLTIIGDISLIWIIIIIIKSPMMVNDDRNIFDTFKPVLRLILPKAEAFLYILVIRGAIYSEGLLDSINKLK